MGKSKKYRTADTTMLKNYVKRRSLWKYIVIGLAVCFFVSFVVLGSLGVARWIGWVFLGLYIAAFIVLRLYSRCPYCGEAIMKDFNSTTHCPRCRRPIKPNATMIQPRDSLK